MMEFTPYKIFTEFSTNKISRNSAIEQLITIIENSNDYKIRIECIRVLGKIEKTIENSESTRDIIFNLFENLLISDTNERIRNAAAIILKENFLERALSPMKWALTHDDSPLCLETIFQSLIEIIRSIKKKRERLSKLILIQEIKKIEEKDFKIGFETLTDKKSAHDFSVKELAEILINYYAITFLKKVIWRLKYSISYCRVVELDFIFKGLTKLPEAIKYFDSLKVLILRYNQLTSLPDWISSLKDLESFNLNVNNINTLPDSIGSLTSLKELLLWKNELQTLPESFGALSSLNNLNLRLNQLLFLPERFGELSKLKDLNLHDNKLTFLPESFGSLINLENLNLSWNSLESLPNSIGSLSSLKILDLERNELINIPKSIGDLNSLEILNIGDNRLKQIPNSIGNLKSLKILNISKNYLTELPNTLGSLNILEELYINDNLIKMIPKELKMLEQNGLKIFF